MNYPRNPAFDAAQRSSARRDKHLKPPAPAPPKRTAKVPYATSNSGVAGRASVSVTKEPWETD